MKSAHLSRYDLVQMVLRLRGELETLERCSRRKLASAREEARRTLDETAIEVSTVDAVPTDSSSPPKHPWRFFRHRLPDTRKSKSQSFTIEHHVEGEPVTTHEGEITVGFYPNGEPGEVFLRFDKVGSALTEALDALCVMISLGLQCGMPLSMVTRKFRGYRFGPAGITGDPDIESCYSPLDYMVQWLERHFVPRSEWVGAPAECLDEEYKG